jgi:hypothetical protein
VPALPPSIDALVADLAAMDGAAAVVLGGSRAFGAADAGSDWDLAVYYRGAIDTAALARRGPVHPPGSWGRIMNGGAWLTVDGAKVDVLLRDLDAVDLWSARAEEGTYEVDALLGYLAGAPTYLLRAERAVGQVLRGALPPAAGFPAALATVAPERWRFGARFTLDYARMLAARGDIAGTAGQAAKAVVERAHAILCERRAWVLNEKRIVERAGLGGVQGLFAEIPADAVGLQGWVERVREALM